MAKIEKLKKDVEGVATTVYPVTIPQALIDPTSGKSARAELDEKANHGYKSDPKTLKVVDDAKADHGYESNPKSLKEVDNEKAAHGYGAEPQKTLKEVDDEVLQLAGDVEQLAYVKIKNEAVNGDFENGLIAPLYKNDGGGGESTLTINNSTPISGNYDIRLTIITPSTDSRPQLRGLGRAADIGDKIYLHFYAKILSGKPAINAIHNGGSSGFSYSGSVINGRNTRIIDVVDTSDNLGLIYFNSPSVWDMQMDNFIRINLTETFGAGNEPTEEEMNLLLDIAGLSYIDDEAIIPAQKIMQWELALIRKNKNAIIALGGTII